MRKKICFVVQRYGEEVNGGAEYQCRTFAEHMNRDYEVHVVTTKAIDYVTWKNEYKNDVDTVNGVEVHRFKSTGTRQTEEFNSLTGKFIYGGSLTDEEEKRWIETQGPESPELLRYIQDNRDSYAAFVFFTYLYYPSVMGLPLVAEKSIFVPEAHDEPYMRMRIIRSAFHKTHSFFFNTEEERALVYGMMDVAGKPSDIGGTGIDNHDDADAGRFQNKYHVGQYIIYVGRIEEAKGCDRLFLYFNEYRKRNHSDLKLVLMGKNCMNIPDYEGIVNLGFVSEEDKYDGIAGAEALVLPSENESLSLVVLEAMDVHTPVVVNGKCPVLKAHCIKSNGAFYYNSYFEFEGEINFLLTHPEEKKIMCENAYAYVKNNYQWDVLVDRFSALIEQIDSENRNQ